MQDKGDVTQKNILNIYNYDSIFIFPYPNSLLYLGSDYENLIRGYSLKYYKENEKICTSRRSNDMVSVELPLSSVFGPLGWWQLSPSPLSLGNLSENQDLINFYTRKDIIDTMGTINTKNLIIIDRPFNDLMSFKSKVSDRLLKNCIYFEKKLCQTPRDYREYVIRETIEKNDDIRNIYIYDDVEYDKFYKELFRNINQTIANKVIPIFVPVPKVEYSLPVEAEIRLLKSIIQDFNRKMSIKVPSFNSVTVRKRIFATGFMVSKDSMKKLVNNFMFVKNKMLSKLNEEQSSRNGGSEKNVSITNELILVAPYGLGKRFEQLGGEGKLIALKTESYHWDQEHDFLLVKFKPFGNFYERVKHFLKNDREKNLILVLFCNTSYTKFEKLLRSSNLFNKKFDWVKSVSNFVVTAYATQRWVLTFGNVDSTISAHADIEPNGNTISSESFNKTSIINSQMIADLKKKKRNVKNSFVSEEVDFHEAGSKKKPKQSCFTFNSQKNEYQNSDANCNSVKSQTVTFLPERPKKNIQQLQVLKNLVEIDNDDNVNLDSDFDLHY